MRRSLSGIALIAIALTGATALSADDAYVSLVPWKVVEPGEQRETVPLALYWVPSSRDELRRSALLTSDELTLFAARCVAMRIVRLDDRETLKKLEVDGELPDAILADQEGDVIARAPAENLAAVEAMVRNELDERAVAAEALLREARAKADAGELAAAISLYRRVSEQRCVCPRPANAARRALKRLEK